MIIFCLVCVGQMVAKFEITNKGGHSYFQKQK